MNVTLENTLTDRSNLTLTTGVHLRIGPCGQLPVGVGIYQGNYGVENMSEGDPLGLSYPGPTSCPEAFQIAYFSFAPSSDVFTLVSPQPNLTDVYTQAATATEKYFGYWTGTIPFIPVGSSPNITFRSFSPGNYTMVGEDAFGQMAILHFKVLKNANPLDCATIASNSSFVSFTNGTSSAGPLKLQSYYQNLGSNRTVVLALSNTGNSTLTLLSFDSSSFHYGNSPYQFSPDGIQVQSWQYYAPNGTLSYPALFYPNECSLISVTNSSPLPRGPLTLSFTDNETQTFTFSP